MNAGSNWVNTAVTGVVQLVLIPITLRALGESGYGVWALFAYGLSYPMILEGAFALSINRFAAYYANNQEQLNRYVSASFVILTGLAVLTAGAAILVSFAVADMFAAIPDELAGPAQVTCILVGLTLALKMLESTFSGALKGFQYYTRCNGVVIWTTILRAILTVALLCFWKSIIAVQLAFVITGMMSAVLMFLVARKSIPGLSVSVRLIDKDTMRELWRYTSHSIARSGSKIAMENTLMLLVGWKGTATDVAVYNIAFRLPGMIHGFLVGAQNVFLPALTSLCADGQIEKIKAIVKKGTQICSVLTLLPSILLFAFAERILVHWLGAPEQTVGVMRVVMLSVVPGGLFEIWLPALVAMGHLRGLTVAAIAMVISAILLELILLNGLVPVPMAPAIALVAVLWVKTGLWLPLYGLSKLELRPYEYLRDGLLQPLIATAVSIAALLTIGRILPEQSVHWLARLVLLTVVVMASFVAISLQKETAELIVAIRRRFRSGVQQA